MRAIYLLITNGILCTVMSQQSYNGVLGPIRLDQWTGLNGLNPPSSQSLECGGVAAYNENDNVIELFGGIDPRGHYIFNVTSKDYIFVNQTRLSEDIDVVPTAWTYPADGNIIYYETENTGIIRQLNIDTLEDTVFASFTETQPGPGLCVNYSDGTVYSVGRGNIEACTDAGTCTQTHTGINEFVREIDTVDYYMEQSACAVYGDSIFTFGGVIFPVPFVTAQVSPSNLLLKCTVGEVNCTTVRTLDSGGYGIVPLALPCFRDQRVVLIGGAGNENRVTARVEIYDMETDDYFTRPGVNLGVLVTARKGPIIAYDTMAEQIYAFGGIANEFEDCSNTIEHSNAGVCFTLDPTMDPTIDPTADPTSDPTSDPTDDPTSDPTTDPTSDPTFEPTIQPTDGPTQEPITAAPVTAQPTADPASTDEPTKRPTTTTTYEPITEGYTTSGSAYGVVIGLLIAICCIIAICAFWYSKEEKDHVYGRMEQGAAAVVAGGGGGAVPMVAAGAGYGGYEQPKAAAAGGYDNGTAATGYTQSTDQKY